MARRPPPEPLTAMTFSVPCALKIEFQAACIAADVAASQVVRAALRAFVAEQAKQAQQDGGQP